MSTSTSKSKRALKAPHENENEPIAKRAKIESSPIQELSRVYTITTNINDQIEPVSVVFLNRSFTPKVQERLRKIEMCDKLHRYAMNLVKANPNDYKYTSKGETIVHKSSRKPAHFWLLGTIQNSALFHTGARSVSVSISDYTFERAMAVIGVIKKTKVIFLASYNGGVSFSTYRGSSATDTNIEAIGVGPSSPSKKKGNPDNRLNANAPITLPYDVKVPAFEGYERMNPDNLRSNPKLTQELQKNAAVIVGFMIGSYAFKNKTYQFKSNVVRQALSLNIQFVVALAGPANPPHLNEKAVANPAYGVGPPLEYDSEEDMNEEEDTQVTEDSVEWI